MNRHQAFGTIIGLSAGVVVFIFAYQLFGILVQPELVKGLIKYVWEKVR